MGMSDLLSEKKKNSFLLPYMINYKKKKDKIE